MIVNKKRPLCSNVFADIAEETPTKNPKWFNSDNIVKKHSVVNQFEKPAFERLGIKTKSSSTLSEKPVNFDAEQLKTARTHRDLRAKRYRLLSKIRKVYFAEGKRRGLEYAANYHRTAKCSVVPTGNFITINKSIKYERSFYSGLTTCGSVWTCPVCSAKIQERRRAEVSKAMNKAYEEGKKCIMVTFTFPHNTFDNLQEMLDNQAKAFKYLRSGRAWNEIKNSIKFSGLIRSLEVTIGKNGWHPHTHELWIVDRNCNVEELRERVVSRWATSCKRNNLLEDSKIADFLLHSVAITDNASNSDYLAKLDSEKNWGVDREIAKASTKTSKGTHPFELLQDSCSLDLLEPKRVELWLDYTKAFKGKRQLYWSPGLKDWAEVRDKTDKELAEEQEELATRVAVLNRSEWRVVVDADAQAEILYRSETGGADLIKKWFTERRRE